KEKLFATPIKRRSTFSVKNTRKTDQEAKVVTPSIQKPKTTASRIPSIKSTPKSTILKSTPKQNQLSTPKTPMSRINASQPTNSVTKSGSKSKDDPQVFKTPTNPTDHKSSSKRISSVKKSTQSSLKTPTTPGYKTSSSEQKNKPLTPKSMNLAFNILTVL